MYSKQVIQHFLHPKHFGKIKNADAVGKAGNPRCGDIMELYLRIDKKNQKIKDVKFHTLGCAAAIATSDMICDLVKEKTIKQALKIKFKDIVKKLGELPPVKIHCSILATQALRRAVENYLKKQKKSKNEKSKSKK